MNAYLKLVLTAGAAVVLSFAVKAYAAAPELPAVVVLPTAVVSNVLSYLAQRPYQEVAGVIGGVQRCLQDQVPDDKGNLVDHGTCPEITASLRRIDTPLPHEPLPHPAATK